MKRFLIVLLVFSFVFTGKVWAQSRVDNFQPLQSEGDFPADFSNTMQQKTNAKDYNDFLYELIKEGRVLYGTPLNEYVDHIADNLLKDYPQLRSELRFYILKSPEVNAYSTEQGRIFVNVGLLAQVSNEAELAFVIAHEIAHYAEHHKLQFDYNSRKQGSDFVSYFLTYQSRSREQESEADRVAIERYFSHSPYSYSVMDGVFDVLQYGDLPFDEISFDKQYVETSFYQFPDNYFLQNVAPITDRSGIIDTIFTHPNLVKRRAAAKSQIANLSNEGRRTFVQSEELFKEIRSLARLECIHLWLVTHQYDKVIYNGYVLKREMPNNSFVDKAMVYAFYGFSKHKNYSQTNQTLSPYKKVEGEMQQVSYFLSKMSRSETSLLALRQTWQAMTKYPEDTCYMELLKDEVRDVFVKNKMKYTDFSDYPMGFDLGSLETMPKSLRDSSQYTSKYEKLRHGNQPDMVKPTSKFKTANYMLVDIHRDSLLQALMNSAIQDEENQQILDAISTPQATDLSKILIVQPICYVHPNKEDFKSLMKASKKSDKLEVRLTDNILKSAKKLKLNPLYFDNKTLKEFDTQQYNDYATLQQWYREYKIASGMEMCYQQREDLSRIAKTMDCSKICLVVTTCSHHSFFSYYKLQSLIFSVFCPYTLPFAVAQLAMPRYCTNVDVVITDFTTGKQDLHSSNNYYSTMSESYLNADVYDELYKYVKGTK
jgi:predicted SprT family Zn-dependent metalloprotease